MGKYKFFQPNPTEKQVSGKGKKGDCAVRSLCAVTGWSWDKAYDELCKYAKEVHGMPNDKYGFEHAMKRMGFKTVSCAKVEAGGRRPRVSTFEKVMPKGKCILNCAHHYVGVVDGDYYDSFDSGQCAVYTYFKYEG